MRIKKTISTIFLAISMYLLPCFAQKQLKIDFPNSTEEMEVTLKYSIKNLINPFYEPYFEIQKTNNNSVTFEIPDSISTFVMEINNNNKWSKNCVLYMQANEKLEIIFDTAKAPIFKGSYARFYEYIYNLKYSSGVIRSESTMSDYMDNSEHSFFTYINKKINEKTDTLNILLENKYINKKQYEFAKEQTIDEFLFRAALIGLEIPPRYQTKIDSTSFNNELNKLFLLYDRTFDLGISAVQKANLRARGLIPFEKVNLGLSYIYCNCDYLDKCEQERSAASNIIGSTAMGQTDSVKLNNQRSLYKKVFPNSIYNTVLDELKPLVKKDYILAEFSVENGFSEYGRFPTDNIQKITGMFLGDKPVLLDFWAIWCAPCIKEFQHNKEIDSFLKENNIGKLYISVDFAGAYEQWKKMIISKQLVGLHYFATQEFASKLSYFEQDGGIPRYVLLDSVGKTLIEKCELPSSGKLIEQIEHSVNITK